MSDDETPFARGFKVTFPDGYYLDGAQFPSGRCVLDDATSGLVQAAVSLEELLAAHLGVPEDLDPSWGVDRVAREHARYLDEASAEVASSRSEGVAEGWRLAAESLRGIWERTRSDSAKYWADWLLADPDKEVFRAQRALASLAPTTEEDQ